ASTDLSRPAAGDCRDDRGGARAMNNAADQLAQEGLAAEGVTVTYRNGHMALKDVTFAIPRGTVTALVGVNGSGKSTLFKAIMGFVPLSRGSVRILGEPGRLALRRNAVAYVPQSEDV